MACCIIQRRVRTLACTLSGGLAAPAVSNRALLDDICHVHAASRRRYGSPRVHATLRAEGKHLGRSRIASLMHRHSIQARRKRHFQCTTDSHHALPLAPNLLAWQFMATVPNRIWLADITYIPTAEGWLYPAVVPDMFSRKVVGWAMRETVP